MTKSRWIDGHLDLAYIELEGRDLCRDVVDPATACVTLPTLREGGVDLAFATVFTEPHPLPAGHAGAYRPDDADAAERAGFEQIEIYERLEQAGEVSIVRSRQDLSRAGGPRPRLVLLMEGADPIRDPGEVESWYRRGLRLVGLTWGMGTRYAGGNAAHGPLTDAGRDLVAALDEHGIAHDASHLCDEALEAVFELATGPIVATHSNCRALAADNERHLTDDAIAEITSRGGLIGFNMYSRFIVDGDKRATVADCVAHVERIVSIAGHKRCVGLGSDMDGGFGPTALPIGMDHPTRLDALADALTTAGWTADEVEGFRWRNWYRFLEGLLPAE